MCNETSEFSVNSNKEMFILRIKSNNLNFPSEYVTDRKEKT